MILMINNAHKITRFNVIVTRKKTTTASSPFLNLCEFLPSLLRQLLSSIDLLELSATCQIDVYTEELSPPPVTRGWSGRVARRVLATKKLHVEGGSRSRWIVACALRALRWPPVFLRSLPVTLLIENSTTRRLHFGGREGGRADSQHVEYRGPREIDTIRTRANIAV